MPFTFKLSKRLALMKASLIPAAATALTMCQLRDSGITAPTSPSKSVMPQVVAYLAVDGELLVFGALSLAGVGE